MKKFLALAIVICISILHYSMPVSADESSDSAIISNIQVLDSGESGLIHAFTFYSRLDEKTYIVKTYADHVNVYDENEKLLNTMEFSSIHDDPIISQTSSSNNTVMTSGADAYEKWGRWTYYRRDNMHIGDITGWTISTLAGALTGVFGSFLGPLAGLATIIYNKKYEDIYANIYISTNVYCTILVKQKYFFYSDSTNVYIKSEEKAPSWWGSPWDYTQPAACRILAERY